MAFFKKLFKVLKFVSGVPLIKAATKPARKLIKQAIGGIFRTPKIPGFPDIPTPAGAPTFAQAGGPASRGGAPSVNIGLSLISSGGAAGLAKRARTKKRTLIGGA